ncbi:HAD-like protein [Tuber magnatum]|uniref:HAD-like protein n=1 Tax=Tuber magnatum TaxID=42249 RepID=A0A317SS50_9PEZI|nr:HAD-like protein [Tuber magnatum]
MTTPARLRFAPLDTLKTPPAEAPKLQGIVFDVDGTLCEPQTWMFARMRAALGIAKSVDILDHVYSLEIEKQPAAMESIRMVEKEAMLKMIPQKGLIPFMEYLDRRGIRKAICTRNFETPVNYLISNFMQGHVFSPIITREFRPPKPDPAGILHISKSWGLEDGGEGLIMVGDSVDDITAGRRAGSATVLLANDVNRSLVAHENTDCVVENLEDLIPILESGFIERDRTASNPKDEH